MSNSFTISDSSTFTITHARHLAAKIATDLKRVQRFYLEPNDQRIARLEAEATLLLKAGYLGTITYGFQKNGKWIEPTLRYTPKDLAGLSSSDDDPGRIRADANVAGAEFKTFLVYSASYLNLSSPEQAAFASTLPFSRGDGNEPGLSGYLSQDKTYSAGGRAIDRSTLRSL
jgi:hypothetical protein